jgi:hypothetical protein
LLHPRTAYVIVLQKCRVDLPFLQIERPEFGNA